MLRVRLVRASGVTRLAGWLAVEDQPRGWGPVSLGSFLEALRQQWGPHGVSRATGSLVGASSLAGVSADKGGCLCSFLPCRFQTLYVGFISRGSRTGHGTARQPANGCQHIRAGCTPLPAFTHSRVHPSWRPRPRPKTRSSSQHGKSRGPASGLCPARGAHRPHSRGPCPSTAHTQVPATASLEDLLILPSPPGALLVPC